MDHLHTAGPTLWNVSTGRAVLTVSVVSIRAARLMLSLSLLGKWGSPVSYVAPPIDFGNGYKMIGINVHGQGIVVKPSSKDLGLTSLFIRDRRTNADLA